MLQFVHKLMLYIAKICNVGRSELVSENGQKKEI